MNSKTKITKKDLRLAYSQGNYTAYPLDIKAAAWYLSTQYPNNKPSNQRGSNKGDKKGDDPKSEDKDNIRGGTAGVHVEDTTTNADTTTPSGGASLSAHVLETSQATSCPLRTVEERLGSHPIDDNFWYSTNPADVSIDMVNSGEQMVGSHITEFHTHEDEQPVIADLLSQEDQDFDNRQLMALKHDTGRGYHNPSDPQPTTSVDCKLVTHKDESISFETMNNEDTTDIMD